LTRHSDWEQRLGRYFKANLRQPFLWGHNDCALFVCNAILEMTGVDLAADARGKYDSKETADLFLAASTADWHGSPSFGGLAEYADKIAAQHGLEEVSLSLARRGDIVLWDVPGVGPALGIVSLDGIYAWFAGPNGITKNKVRKCDTAWRVG